MEDNDAEGHEEATDDLLFGEGYLAECDANDENGEDPKDKGRGYLQLLETA